MQRSRLWIGALIAMTPALVWADTALAERRMVVTGEAQVMAVPDMATISVGASGRGASATEAMNATSAALEAMIAELEAQGVEARDIQTSALWVREDRVWDRDRNEEISRGFVSGNTLRVRVRDLPDLGAILGALLDDGANQINGLDFGLADPAPLETEARKAAVKDAMDKAAVYAGAAQVTLGPLLSLTDSASPAVAPLPRMAEPMMLEKAASDVPVAAGEISARAEVTLMFEIRDAE